MNEETLAEMRSIVEDADKLKTLRSFAADPKYKFGLGVNSPGHRGLEPYGRSIELKEEDAKALYDFITERLEARIEQAVGQ